MPATPVSRRAETAQPKSHRKKTDHHTRYLPRSRQPPGTLPTPHRTDPSRLLAYHRQLALTEYARDRHGNLVAPLSRVMTIAHQNPHITEPTDVTNAALRLLQNKAAQTMAAQDDTDVIDWNDHPGRTPQQIAQVFTAAIAAAPQECNRPVHPPVGTKIP